MTVPPTGQGTLLVSRGSEGEHRAVEDDLLSACTQALSCDVLIIPHLYHLPHTSPVWMELAHLPGPVVLVSWIHPRPAEQIARQRGVEASQLTALNFAAYSSTQERLAAISAAMPTQGQALRKATLREISVPTDHRWYPVIDQNRCRSCRNCLQFCLFGVYDTTPEGHVVVARPDDCKPGCPACSRICPHSAIMFPLYAKNPAIAGAPGHFVELDLAARRMFYEHTGRPCPVCGLTGKQSRPADETFVLCPECGRQPLTQEPGSRGSRLRDDIDALIDELDALNRRGR